jgi:nicotinate phosphoribosyltransferase
MDWLDWQKSVLLTDLYQLTMLQGYFERGMEDEAVFEFFVRRQPEQRNFLLAAGLEQVLDYLESLAFSATDIACLVDTGLFSAAFLDYLRGLRFRGSVEAMPEGTVFFADEPVLRVVGPLPQAQLVESRLINLLHFQTLIASKAARCTLAAPDKLLVDFGMRRSHGAEAAVLAARASYLAGFGGTATVVAKPLYGIPIFGTMAHSFIESHDSEPAAFESFARAHHGAVVLLIDTYDTERGARRVVELAARLADAGIRIHSVRLDSGDPAVLSKSVRGILDEGGWEDIGIFASGGLDEYELCRLHRLGAPIDGYGIGTSVDVSADAPSLDCVYKIQEYAGRARRKRSTGKATWPGRKQVFRLYDDDGRLSRDILTIQGDSQPGRPLLEPVMRDGRRLAPSPSLDQVRATAAAGLEQLPASLRSLEAAAGFTVEVAGALKELAASVDKAFR